jgi:hypothetical protein
MPRGARDSGQRVRVTNSPCSSLRREGTWPGFYTIRHP